VVDKADLGKVYDWRQAQATNLASACFTLSGLILSPLLAAILEGRDLAVWQLSTYFLGALLAVISGVLWHREARHLQAEYLTMVTRPDPTLETLRW